MGIKNIQQSELLGQAPEHEKEILELFPSEQQELWESLENVRLQFDGNYRFLRLRGGSDSKLTFPADIITLYGFTAPVNGEQEDFLAVHTFNGNLYLLSRTDHLAPASPTLPSPVFADVFGGRQVSILNNGKILYIFDVHEGVYKVYDMETEQASDWLDSLSGSITSAAWNEEEDFTEDNIWGYEVGKEVIAMHSFTTGDYTDPLTQEQTFRAFLTRLDGVDSEYLAYEDPSGASWRSTFDDNIGVAPNSADLSSLIGAPASRRFDDDGVEENNPDFETPFISRGYVVVDLLSDGSYAPPGRPSTVSTSIFRSTRFRRNSVRFTISEPPVNVEKRLLFCTRWQVSERNVFTPSRPEYDNGAFFFCKEIDTATTSFTDRTPDRDLLLPMSNFVPMSAGTLQSFMLGQLSPESATSIENTLLLGGYTLNRPTPDLYNDPANPGKGNSFVRVGDGDALTGNPTTSLVFEYTDGKKSAVADSSFILTDSEQQIDTGQDGDFASAEVWITNAPDFFPTGSGTLQIQDENNLSDSVTINYEQVSAFVLADIMVDAINSSLSMNVTATRIFDVLNSNFGVRIDYNEVGIVGNTKSVLFTYSDTIELNSTADSLSQSLSGGDDPIDPQIVSGNRLTLHSINGLVSKVFVLIKRGADYFLQREIEVTEGRFHGRRIFLPNSDSGIEELSSYDIPSGNDIREAVNLYDRMVAAVPYQMPRIGEQARIKNGAAIRRLIPTTFDVDKSQMRLQVQVFTDRDLQVGYLLLSGGNVQYDFEVIGEGVTVTHKFGAWRVEGNTIYQAADGIYNLRGGDYNKIIDRYQYDSLENDLQKVVYNNFHKEYWLFLSDNKVIVTSADGSIRKRFTWPYGDVNNGSVVAEDLFTAHGDTLYENDIAETADGVTDITGKMITTHIGDPRTQTKILEVAVSGQDGQSNVALDLQRQRLERNNSNWTTGFNGDVTTTDQNLYIHGVPFTFTHRAVMPKIAIELKGDSSAFISHILLTHIPLENKGKAR